MEIPERSSFGLYDERETTALITKRNGGKRRASLNLPPVCKRGPGVFGEGRWSDVGNLALDIGKDRSDGSALGRVLGEFSQKFLSRKVCYGPKDQVILTGEGHGDCVYLALRTSKSWAYGRTWN